MSYDLLTSSGVASLVSSYKNVEQSRSITPLNTRKANYERLNSAWTGLSSRLTSLNSLITELKDTSSASVFSAKSAKLSSTAFLDVTTDRTATAGDFSVRVQQLAKSDVILSARMASDDSLTTMAGTHSLGFSSGDFRTSFAVTLTDAETNKTAMEKIAKALNDDFADVTSAAIDKNTTFSGSGSFKIDMNGTETTINYDYSSGSFTYGDVIDDLVTKIGAVSGVKAEKIIDGDNVSLKVTAESKAHYLSMTGTSGDLLNSGNLNINLVKEKAASSLASASAFTPVTGSTKLSITAKNTGYDNRLIFDNKPGGSVLDFTGLTNNILQSRTTPGDDSSAGFLYTSNSITDNQLNAKFLFNGVSIQRNSNSFSDLVSGVTFNLKGVHAGTDIDTSVNVDNDTSSMKSKVEAFVAKFNESYQYIKSRTVVDKTSRGIFSGDSVANGLLQSLRSTVTSEVSGVGDYNSLAKIGISFDPTTGLTVSDSAKLTTALSSGTESVAGLFQANNGLAKSLENTLKSYTDVNGTITRMTTSFTSNITYLNDRIKATQERIDKGAEVLRKRYEGLQLQLAALLNSAQAYTSFSSY